MNLHRLFNKYRCDKGFKHGYHEVYEKEFEPIREKPINILEIGIFKGTSTSAFLEYFPNAMIYGIDIFERINPSDIAVLQHERVRWLKGDSLSRGIKEKIKTTWSDVKFDIVIDDAKHTPEANAITFKNISPFLKDDGMYFVEDVFPMHKMSIKDMDNEWVKSHKDELNYLEFIKFEKAIDGWEVKEFDLRKKSKQPESYIFKMYR